MSELTKTSLFAAAALAAAGLAWFTRTGPVGVAPPEEIGRPLFPEFTDPLAAKSLRIVRYDEGLANLSEIEVKQVDGIWTLPSHEGYPADAENRVRDAAAPFVGLNVINIASDAEGQHALYGVQEPGQAKTAVGDQGVGTLVSIKDGGGNSLVNLVIGKEVKDRPGQRFVRRVGQSRVYVAEIDPQKLPAKFEDWIDKDLLKISSFDLQQLVLKDYSFQVAQTLSGPVTDFDQRLEITLTNDNAKWKLDRLLEARDGSLQPTQLLEGEELNEERLNALRDALDNLEIVDVERKPAGLGADLKADKGFFSDQAGVDSLVQRGIFPVQIGEGDVELLSTDGEVLVRSKEGVEYVLRFGRVAGVDTESTEGKLNRYLLVSTRVNDAQFPEPVLEPLPELPPAAPATETKPTALLQSTEAPAEDAPIGPAEGSETASPGAGSTAAPPTEAPAAKPADIQSERERITKENQRKIDERNDKLKKARDTVRELNFRFADWYYVISEDVYKKIHLGRSDIIKETEAAKKQGFGVDAFRSLEEQGLTPQPSAGDETTNDAELPPGADSFNLDSTLDESTTVE